MIRSLYLELKNQGLYSLVPSAILLLLVPLAVHSIARGPGANIAEVYVICQLLIPSFSTWWPVLLLREYVESPGKELLFVHKSRISLLLKVVALWALFSLQILSVCLYLSYTFEGMVPLFVALSIQSLALISFGFSVALLIQNTFIPLILIFSYTLIFLLVVPAVDSSLSIFEHGTIVKLADLKKTPTVASLCILLIVAAYQIESRYLRQRL